MRYSRFGVTVHDKARATPGFTLFSPNFQSTTYLIGMGGEVLHKWDMPLRPGAYAYLLKNGNLLWSGRTPEGCPIPQGKGGLLRELDWDGSAVWEYRDDNQHHDFRRRENGNTLYIGWEAMRPGNAARVKGGRPGTELQGVMYGDYVREVDRAGATVWEWHAQDDLEIERYPLHASVSRREFAHANACFPLENGDVMLSFRVLSTILIIDRNTRKVRWERRDDAWGMQHDCQMLPNGHITLFANGHAVPDRLPHSRAIELDPQSGQILWEYRGNPPWTFNSPHISGVQRLASGNTLICEGMWGRIFEVTPQGEIVWEYINPFDGEESPGVMANCVFRAYRYAADSAEIRGRLGFAEA